MASHWFYHFPLTPPYLIPLAYILSPNHHLNSLAPSPSHFPVILYRKFSQKVELHSSSISFLCPPQTGFCHHTSKTAPVKVTSNLQLAKPVSNISVILFNLLAVRLPFLHEPLSSLGFWDTTLCSSSDLHYLLLFLRFLWIFLKVVCFRSM